MRTLRCLWSCAALLLAGCESMEVSFRNAAMADAAFPQRAVVATLARPEGEGPYPAVVLLHSCAGMQPHVGSDWPRFLVSLGYVALTVDSFGSRGLAPCPNPLHPADRLPKTDAYRELARDAYGALDYLATLPFVARDRVALMGFSVGADTINSFLVRQQARAPREFAAAIGLYGRCNDLPPQRPRLPLMQLAGELDTARVDACRAVSAAMEVHVLDSAYHAWDSPGAARPGPYGETMQFSAAATERSRRLVNEFLARHLKRQGCATC